MFSSKKGIRKNSTFFFILVVIVLQIHLLSAKTWYEIFRDSTYTSINAVTTLSGDLGALFAVGNSGNYFQIYDSGQWMDMRYTGFPENLYAITYAKGWINPDSLLLAAGENGRVLYYNFPGDFWQPVDTLGNQNFRSISYDNSNEIIYLAGDSSTVFFSNDFGLNWQKAVVEIPDLSNTLVVSGMAGTLIIGTRHDTTFIIKKVEGVPLFPASNTDTIPDFFAKAAQFIRDSNYNMNLYITGNLISSGEGQVWAMEYVDTNLFDPQLYFFGINGDITAIGGTSGSSFNDLFWITTAQGEIWESTDRGISWYVKYVDPLQRKLGPLFVLPDLDYEPDIGRVLGDEGLILKYGFELQWFFPHRNAHVDYMLDRMELHFSSPAEIDSIRNGVYLSSSISGRVSFNAEYNAIDSSTIFLFPTRPSKGGGMVPGERWQMIISDRIREKGDQSGEPFPQSSNWFNILPFQGSGFQFQSTGNPINKMRLISNPVVGFFDDDDLFDILFCTNDSLYCYSTDQTGNIYYKDRFYIGSLITINPMIERQLVTDDIDGDGKLDLLLFDQNSINIIENHSDTQFSFVVNPNSYFSATIKQIIPYNVDYNRQSDLLVLNDSLYTLLDISFNGFGFSKIIAETYASQYKKVELGDIDLDGIEDLAILEEGGSLRFRHGNGYGSFFDSFISAKTGYKDIYMADLDNDSDLEIVAFTSTEVDAYTFDWAINGSFTNTLLYSNGGNQNISALTIQNFGNANRNMGPLMMDIAVCTTDSLLILENQTVIQGNFQFIPNPQSFRQLPFATKGILYADFNTDAMLDLLIYDNSQGQLEVFHKVTWKPVINNVLYHSKRVIELQWYPPPTDQGMVQFYRVIRDSVPFYNEFSWIREVNETFFLDSLVDPRDIYWYSVSAVFEDGSESLWSDPVQAELFIELDGDITYNLTDTNRVYLARTDVRIPSTSSVTIGAGVEVNFEPGAGFDVFGHLEVRGDWIDDRMVHFHSAKEQDMLWRGITLHPAADTVVFEWFSIAGAEIGIRSLDRPLNVSRGGLQFNQVGLEISNDTLYMANILLDSNMVAADFVGNVQASLKNITVLHSFESGIHIGGGSKVKIRNSVFWYNEGPSIISEVPQHQLILGYSTIDSTVGPVSTVEITREPPLFMPADSGFFRMDQNSPTIDAGFPGDDVGEEPQPNGGIINQGVYGGLSLATPTFAPRIESVPKEVFQQIRPNFSDTTMVYLANSGGEPLELFSVELLVSSGIFTLGDINGPIQPGDTVALPIIFTPQDRVDYLDTLLIVSNDTRVYYRNRKIPLNGRGLNSAPEISGTPVAFARVNEWYEYNIDATDADDDSLIYTALDLPVWLSLSPQGVLSGTPSSIHIGKHPVRVEVSDGYGGITMLNYQITVFLKDNSALAPRAVLKEFPAQIIFQSGVQMNFIVTDDNLNPIDFGEVRVRYYLQNQALDDVPQIIDTTGINSVSYVNLEDGSYLFKVWAYDSLGRGFTGEKADSAEFEVRAFERNVHRSRWYMMAFPRGMDFSWEQFNYPDSSAMLLVWDNKEEDYLPLNRRHIPAGTGFWIMPMEDLSFDLSSYERLHPGEEAPDILTIPLQKGWNQVGLPVDYSTAWKDMFFHADSMGQDYTFLEAVQQGFLEGAVHWFIQFGNKQGYNLVELDSLALAYPWLAYWIKTTTTGTLTFTTQPAFRENIISAADTTLLKPLAKNNGSWKVNISLQNKDYADMTNILGAGVEKAKAVQEPPPFGEYCAFYFTGEKGRSSISYKAEETEFDLAVSWDAVAESRNSQVEHILEWDISDAQIQGIHLLLLDRQTEKIIPMDEQSSYTFIPGQRYYRFRIYASTDASFEPEIVPLSYRLGQNYPNPFNPNTTIRFGIPEEAAGKTIALKIYDVLGREVATLINRSLKAGYHQVEWNGRNSQGQTVASGIYFYRLQSGNTTRQVKKMILLR